jgi:hypothetical protein
MAPPNITPYVFLTYLQDPGTEFIGVLPANVQVMHPVPAELLPPGIATGTYLQMRDGTRIGVTEDLAAIITAFQASGSPLPFAAVSVGTETWALNVSAVLYAREMPGGTETRVVMQEGSAEVIVTGDLATVLAAFHLASHDGSPVVNDGQYVPTFTPSAGTIAMSNGGAAWQWVRVGRRVMVWGFATLTWPGYAAGNVTGTIQVDLPIATTANPASGGVAASGNPTAPDKLVAGGGEVVVNAGGTAAEATFGTSTGQAQSVGFAFMYNLAAGS